MQRLNGSALPIFRQERDGKTLFYAPGYLALVPEPQAQAFEQSLLDGACERSPAAVELLRHAVQAQQVRSQLPPRPFMPLCLTLYLHNACNLECSYCFSSPSNPSDPTERLDLAAIRAAAELVAENCAALNRAGATRPLTAVFHGGGEPALDQRQVDAALDTIEGIAAVRGLAPFRYIATNGILSESKARWLARRFDLVGLSCDGPPDIQSRQRPFAGSHPGTNRADQPSAILERTARVLREEGQSFHVRVTVTPDSSHRQAKIAEYICQRLQPQEIHIEPVYRGGRAEERSGFQPDQAGEFATEFLRARNVARAYGVPWLTSASRLGEIHGPYCQVDRDVLLLLPDGVATACFKTVTAAQASQQNLAIGQVNPVSRRFELDQAAVQHLQAQTSRLLPVCQDCFNSYHCTRGCPDNCILVYTLEEYSPGAEFRCRVQKLLVDAYLWEIAAGLESIDRAEVASTSLTHVITSL